MLFCYFVKCTFLTLGAEFPRANLNCRRESFFFFSPVNYYYIYLSYSIEDHPITVRAPKARKEDKGKELFVFLQKHVNSFESSFFAKFLRDSTGCLAWNSTYGIHFFYYRPMESRISLYQSKCYFYAIRTNMTTPSMIKENHTIYRNTLYTVNA